MKKIIYRIFLILIVSLTFLIIYLSSIGIETEKFNSEIKDKIKNINQNIDIELKKIKLVLDPFNLRINAKTLGPRLSLENGLIELESIESHILLRSILNNKFSLSNLHISTKSIEIKKLISFVRAINRSTELLILENFIKKGFLIADIKIDFDENGNIKNNFNIKGFVKDSKIKFLKKHELDKINFIFEADHKEVNLKEFYFSYNKLDLFFEKISVKNIKKNFFVNGEFTNKNFSLSPNIIHQYLNSDFLKIKNINLDSKNKFSFVIDKNFKLKDLNFDMKTKINELIIMNNFKLKKFFPEIKEEIILNNHFLNINYNKEKFNIKGNGNILLQNSSDKIDYLIVKNDEILKFNTLIEIRDNPFKIDFLNFKNNENELVKLSLDGNKDKNDNLNIDKILLINDLNKINIEKISLNKNLELLDLKLAEFIFKDKEKINNDFKIQKKNKNYILMGYLFNANNLLEILINDDKNEDITLFKNNFKLDINLENFRLDNEFIVKNFNGSLSYSNNKFSKANLNGSFGNSKKIKFTINSINDEKITTFYSDYAKPFVKRYKFIKGFEDGSIDFYSNTINNNTTSSIKLYDFKLNELPVLTKILTLASLQGIADLLTGEGIRFNEFEMNFNTNGSLMNIDEIYAIGPAISILMDGYIEKKKLVSLRGTLVPATTLNKVIGSIPFLGDILVGSKTGEGVFGVSFKIKGPPKKLETSVNPIKTLTPRFITRTLEKIKKAN